MAGLSDGTGFYTAAKEEQLPSALVGGRLDSNLGSWLGSTLPTVGQKTKSQSIPVTLPTDQGAISVTDSGSNTAPTFFVVFDRIAPAANKYMAVLYNTSSTKKVIVHRIARYNWQSALVAGVTLEQYLAKITAYTGGTATTIRSMDSADVLPAGINAVTGAATVTEDFLVRRFFASSEEANFGNANYSNAPAVDTSAAIYERTPGTRGFVLRLNQGLAIRNVTNSAIGTVSYAIEFTVEDV
jgi:hypothetical protein